MRNLSKICKNFTEAEIYFHVDLDGVTSALLMKKHLSKYNVKVVDAHTIQYGDREWSIPKPKPGRMYVLVDFAHGKTMFHVHTDHHDRQTGVSTTCVDFRKARCNAETLDNNPIQYFPTLDLEIIRTVDSANFIKHNIRPENMRNFIVSGKISDDVEQNKWTLGLACNKLLLTYKNKPSFLKLIVLHANTSLMSIYQHALFLKGKFEFPSLEETQLNSDLYRNRMKDFYELDYDARNKIIQQYGGGFMFNPGSYDRYIVFENHPLSEFLIMIWPMGLLQVSCNPFREQRLKGINLGDISKDILNKHKSSLENILINLYDVKYENEKRIIKERRKALKNNTQDKERIGFHTADLLAIYEKNLIIEKDSQLIKYDSQLHSKFIHKLSNIIDKRIYEINKVEENILNKIHISAYDLINNNSGGHAAITNVTAFNYLEYNQTSTNKEYNTKNYTEVMKIFANDVYHILVDKIKISKEEEKNEIDSDWSLYV